MSRIGILTFHNIPNFGAILQCFSLCHYIKNYNVECEVINYINDNLVSRERAFHLANNKLERLYQRIFHLRQHQNKIEHCDNFINNNISISMSRYNKDNIYKLNELYDVIIVGSDMVWDGQITNNDSNYLLGFANDKIKKFSYAASGGLRSFDSEESEKLLKNFSMISVREKSLRRKCEKLGCKARVDVDPTMLLNPTYWLKFISNRPKEKNYVLVYFPYDRILNAAKKYAHMKGKKILVIAMGMSKDGIKKIWPASINEWLTYIYYADCVFTDSYHGLLFSLYFHKKVCTANKGERQLSLLSDLGLTNCLIDDDNEDNNIFDVNWNLLDEKMHSMRIESEKYIKEEIINYEK